MSDAPPALDTTHAFNCPACALSVPEGLAYCPRCRAGAEGRPFDPREVDAHERQYVISLVVLTLGALAIPRLARSSGFSPGEKLLLALLGCANTGAVVAVCVWFSRWFPAYLESLTRR